MVWMYNLAMGLAKCTLYWIDAVDGDVDTCSRVTPGFVDTEDDRVDTVTIFRGLTVYADGTVDGDDPLSVDVLSVEDLTFDEVEEAEEAE